jgi:hypothetical protein
MGSPDIDSSVQSPLRIEPLFGQVPENVLDASVDQARDVLQEDGEAGSRLANDPGNLRPEPPVVAGLGSRSGGAPGGTRESSSDDVHRDRRWRYPSLSHARQDRCWKGFSFDVTDGSHGGTGGSEPEIDASDPGAQGEQIDGGTWIHVMPSPSVVAWAAVCPLRRRATARLSCSACGSDILPFYVTSTGTGSRT